MTSTNIPIPSTSSPNLPESLSPTDVPATTPYYTVAPPSSSTDIPATTPYYTVAPPSSSTDIPATTPDNTYSQTKT
jgi:hypothetical protein